MSKYKFSIYKDGIFIRNIDIHKQSIGQAKKQLAIELSKLYPVKHTELKSKLFWSDNSQINNKLCEI